MTRAASRASAASVPPIGGVLLLLGCGCASLSETPLDETLRLAGEYRCGQVETPPNPPLDRTSQSQCHLLDALIQGNRITLTRTFHELGRCAGRVYGTLTRSGDFALPAEKDRSRSTPVKLDGAIVLERQIPQWQFEDHGRCSMGQRPLSKRESLKPTDACARLFPENRAILGFELPLKGRELVRSFSLRFNERSRAFRCERYR